MLKKKNENPAPAKTGARPAAADEAPRRSFREMLSGKPAANQRQRVKILKSVAGPRDPKRGFAREWGFNAGDVIEVQGDVATEWIRAGVAERTSEPPGLVDDELARPTLGEARRDRLEFRQSMQMPGD